MARIDLQRGLETAFVTSRHQPRQLLVVLGGQQRRHESFDLAFGKRPLERVDDLSVANGENCRNALNAESLGESGILVDVDLGEHHLAVGGVDDLLEDRPEHLARSAPRRPEVDHDRRGLRTLQDLRFESGIGDVDRHGEDDTGTAKHQPTPTAVFVPGAKGLPYGA